MGEAGTNTSAEAPQGELGTFHYTNAAPQQDNLNQREWAALEDYILDAVETHRFRATVFTGPVLRNDDRKINRASGRPAILIPEEFWQIAVIVDADSSLLSATGYVPSQGRMTRQGRYAAGGRPGGARRARAESSTGNLPSSSLRWDAR